MYFFPSSGPRYLISWFNLLIVRSNEVVKTIFELCRQMLSKDCDVRFGRALDFEQTHPGTSSIAGGMLATKIAFLVGHKPPML